MEANLCATPEKTGIAVIAGPCSVENREQLFETATRNILDLSGVPLLKRLSHLPVE
jgi:3-deoxy-D-arabino-heptulosonate 7-phosphate (DAHP) synthase